MTRFETLRTACRTLTVFLLVNGPVTPRAMGQVGQTRNTSADASGLPVYRAGSLEGNVRLDGYLVEPAWIGADSIASFTEIEPAEGAFPSVRTVVRVLADRRNLVIGVMAYDPEPDAIVSFSTARDADLLAEDHIRFVLDTFRDGRSGYVFALNPSGARYDALVSNRGEEENANWDAIWEAETARGPWGWSAEIRIPISSLTFKEGLDAWGLNVQRRVQRLQETSRWASPERDYELGQTSRAGRLVGLPHFSLGVGLSVRPSVTVGAGHPSPGASTESTFKSSLDVTQRLGSNLLGSITANTDFAETEVDTRQTNLTRFPLFFPEKRSFFLDGADIFEFGFGLETDVIPFFSRRIGLVEGRQVPLRVGGKVNGRVAGTNLGALLVRTGRVDTLAPAATLAVARVQQNVLEESNLGVLLTFGDPVQEHTSWTAGADFTFQTSRFRGGKNFLVGIWGLVMERYGLEGDRTAVGFKIDYPNDLLDVSLNFKRIGDAFQPALGFVPRSGVYMIELGGEYDPRPSWRWVRQMFHEFFASGVADLDGHWESYRVFMAPVNWRLESGDRFEFNIVPQGERLPESFEVSDGVTIEPGAYDFLRYRLEGGLADKRLFSGQLTWWFGGFYDGHLHQIEGVAAWRPMPILTIELNGEHDVGRLPAGDFTEDLVGVRPRFNVSPDLQVDSFVQYDTESRSIGTNSRARWIFTPSGELFVIYSHNLFEDRYDPRPRWRLESNQLLVKLQYTFRY